MLVVTYIVYNDFDVIKASIESIYDQADRIIAVDGRFIDFPMEDILSTDGTQEYLKSLKKVEFRTAPNFYEPDKRNVYLEGLEEGDYVLNLDADEVVEDEIPKIDTDIGAIYISEPNDVRLRIRYNRYFRYRKGLHYWGKHYLIKDADDMLFASLKVYGKYTITKLPDFKITNYAFVRSLERRDAKWKYYRTLLQREIPIPDY